MKFEKSDIRWYSKFAAHLLTFIAPSIKFDRRGRDKGDLCRGFLRAEFLSYLESRIPRRNLASSRRPARVGDTRVSNQCWRNETRCVSSDTGETIARDGGAARGRKRETRARVRDSDGCQRAVRARHSAP